jgi:flagellar hook-length control protein FliK
LREPREPAIPAAISAEPAAVAAAVDEPMLPSVPGPRVPEADAPAAEPAEVRADTSAVPIERPQEAPRRIERGPGEVGVRMHTPAFADDVGQRVLWMASNRMQSAELRVDPPQLGPVEVRLTLAGDQASLTLLSAHASVRDALQAGLPRLQEMLVGAGIDLGSVHVGSHAPGHEPGAQPHPRAEQQVPWMTASETASAGESQVALRRGLVDTYA